MAGNCQLCNFVSMKPYLVFFVITLFLIACTGSKSVITPPHAISLQVNEKTAYQNVVITLKEINESRCPMNARCIRAGEAVAVLNVVVDGRTERNVQLCTGPDCERRSLNAAYTLSLEDQKYLFRLDSITPDPTKTLEKPVQRAYISLEQSK